MNAARSIPRARNERVVRRLKALEGEIAALLVLRRQALEERAAVL